MNTIRRHGEELFSRHVQQIEEIVRRVAARRRLSPDESEELYSLVMLKVVADDYAVLRRFQGKSSWKTYLVVIIQRVLLDERVKRWGRWRPSARARRLGATAVRLDRRLNRDGLSTAEAIRDLRTKGVDESVAELERLAEGVPRRPGRYFLSDQERLDDLPDRERADRRVVNAERRRTAAALGVVLGTALQEISSIERRLLVLRFGRGWTVRRIADHDGIDVRALYRRFGWILGRLRRRLESVGLSWADVAAILEGRDVELELGLRTGVDRPEVEAGTSPRATIPARPGPISPRDTAREVAEIPPSPPFAKGGIGGRARPPSPLREGLAS